jgi:hypothetical protein
VNWTLERKKKTEENLAGGSEEINSVSLVTSYRRNVERIEYISQWSGRESLAGACRLTHLMLRKRDNALNRAITNRAIVMFAIKNHATKPMLQ